MWYDIGMNPQSLEKKKIEVQTRFDELTGQKQEIDTELVKLQGEYRLLEELINKAKEPKNAK